ncbi:hypothetical protein [Amycolatopsis aidingensis]|uniref:hypothetical protein n=1 Tax=Amycolatopsis aidingensis TaxID=2842453 RepID=UPI001C0C4B2B|nr:hypothetical protein [Amycolatopsis aidingensis]
MSEQQVRDALHAAVAAEPPLDFDPDALVSSAQRRTRRRAVTFASAGVVAVALAAVTVPGLVNTGAERSVPAASAGQPVTGQTAAADRGLEQRAAELKDYLTRRLPELSPSATVVSAGPFGNTADGTVSPDGPRMLAGPVELEYPDGKLSLRFRFDPTGAGEPLPGFPPDADEALGVNILSGDTTVTIISFGQRERAASATEWLRQLEGDPNLSL